MRSGEVAKAVGQNEKNPAAQRWPENSGSSCAWSTISTSREELPGTPSYYYGQKHLIERRKRLTLSWSKSNNIKKFVGLLCFDFPEFRITSLMFDFKVLDSRDWGRGK